MKGYRGIIFDLDGTLLNTLEDLADAVNHTMRQYHLEEKTIEEVRKFVGNGVKRLIELCVPMGEDHSCFNAILETFITYYEANSNHKTRPYDNILELLESLSSENYHLAIVSNKIDSAVKDLNKQYFSKWIEIAIGETKEIRRKPAADMVHACLNQMALSPSEVVYIGDSEVDILTAKNAGIDCISVNWGFRDEKWLKAHGAKCIVSDVKGLEKELLNSKRDSA
ncbi:HAD family hydrolase [Fusibacter ferrireducens]|uniref:HAD family hydrolase n=1 Tax=Fusibacter ferrireducens TaxID=2785058 RepID=A0ABR9ZRJ6_9FIRM|nr:HAD family hydrolase [Fusibacter ferrireducens]MBF4692550.1 HAD family hydrolase [Fusibacter ferrireducens]